MRVKEDSRQCFGLVWYDNEAEAVREGRINREAGQKVNGGFYHDMPCDRAPEFDITDPETGDTIYAMRCQ